MIYDCIIVGSGPAGNSCGIYLGRASLNVLMLEGDFEKNFPGGLLTKSSEVENYLGFPEGIMGVELCEKFREQTEKAGTKIITERATQIKKQKQLFVVETPENTYKTKTVVLATGSYPRKLDVPGFDFFYNKGLSECLVCDLGLPIFKNKILLCIGGGDSCLQEALLATTRASKVYIIHRRDKFRASKILQKRVFENPKIEIIWDTEVIEIMGDTAVKSVLMKNVLTGEIQNLEVRGVFPCLGHIPNTKFVEDLVDLDSEKRIIVDDTMKTSVDGIWAIGDCNSYSGRYRQAQIAAGTGCLAALEIIHHFQESEE